MFNKLGRGRAGAGSGASKRSLPPPHRPTVKGGPRAPLGAGAPRRTAGPPPPPPPPPAIEEGFSLVTGEVDFGAIIKLTPDIVEEMRKVEAAGGMARIRFGTTHGPENVIDVGGKEFKFSWAQEPGDLCDIYEEQQSGDDGQGLLSECGSAWRKLTVERILDESTKKHVRMRSEEAERESKQRTAIRLDGAKPSVKKPVKAVSAAAAESSIRRLNFANEPLKKKQKVESSHGTVSGPRKSVSKSGVSPNITTKGRQSMSPLSSPNRLPERGTSLSPFGMGKSSNIDSINDPLNSNKGGVGNLEKEMISNVVRGSTHEVNRQKYVTANQQMDLRNILITLLSSNPKGMTLKALEKAVGAADTKSGKKIESIIKNIANFQAPGKYLLKPGVEVETSKTRAPESGSSPESVHDHASAFDSFTEKANSEKNEQHSQLSSKVNELDSVEKVDSKHRDPISHTSDRNINDDTEEKACSSSGTGSDSDSDSDSSDSGSDSRSRSKSRSISSSDSGSDGSSNSKKGSDVDVDIMTSDEEGENKNKAAELKARSSPTTWTPFDEEHEQIDIVGIDPDTLEASTPLDLNDSGKGNDMVSAIKVTEEFQSNTLIRASGSGQTEVAKSAELDAYQTNSRLSDKRVPLSPDHRKQSEEERNGSIKPFSDTSERGAYNNIGEKQTMTNDSHVDDQSELSDRTAKSKSKSKRALEIENFQEKSVSAKRAKSASSARTLSSEKCMDIGSQNYGLDERGRTGLSNIARQPSPDFYNAQGLDTEQLGVGTTDRGKALGSVEKPKFSSLKFKSHTDMPDELVDASEKCSVKTVRESSVGDRLSSTPDSYKRNYVEKCATGNDSQVLSHSQKYDINKSSSVNGKGAVLRRELSDLELGEFREASSGEEIGGNQKFVKNDNFKSLDIATINAGVDTSNGRTANAKKLPKQLSPTNLKTAVHGNQEGFNRRVPVDGPMNSTRTHKKAIPSNNQQFPRVYQTDTDAIFQMDKPVEVASKNESRAQGMGLENHAGAWKNSHVDITPQKDDTHAGRMCPKDVRESRPQRSNASRDSVDRSNNSLSIENGHNDRKRRESSSEADDSIYSKYDKDKPELKGPIKDFSQYEKYVKEYTEKYCHYRSLNERLVNTRNEFLQVAKELEDAKERDTDEFRIIHEELKEMYSRRGPRHKQLKKIFVLLHEELKSVKQRIMEFAQTYAKD